ncbi:Prolyl 4-hydroxylase 1 [Linum grandiflorum]
MQECDYLRALARPRLEVSTVVDAKTGKGIKSNVRTSSGMFLSSAERRYPLVKAIEKRIAVYSQVPSENGELIQVLRWVFILFPYFQYSIIIVPRLTSAAAQV